MTPKSYEIGFNRIEFEAGIRHDSLEVNRSLVSTQMRPIFVGVLIEEDARHFAASEPP